MFNKLSELLKNEKREFESITPGLYSFLSPQTDPMNYRLHLRVEKDSSGVLIINASTVLHLNPTGVEYAYFLVNQRDEEELINFFIEKYRINRQDVLKDYHQFKDQINTLISTPDLDPVNYFESDPIHFSKDSLSAPYRLDCALTYNFGGSSSTPVQLKKRVDKELSTSEWLKIIDDAWAFGIPQIIFTGGEPTLREDLVTLLNKAELNGQVTGLITNGKRLGDPAYLNELLQAGLDHTMIVLEPDDDSSWKSLANFQFWQATLQEDIFVAVHLTITNENKGDIFALIDKLATAGVSAISLSENNPDLRQVLEQAREYVADLDIDLVWDLPVPYSSLNPIQVELVENDESEKLPFSGEALYIEPDGDVLLEQDSSTVLGNLLTDDWETVWKKIS